MRKSENVKKMRLNFNLFFSFVLRVFLNVFFVKMRKNANLMLDSHFLSCALIFDFHGSWRWARTRLHLLSCAPMFSQCVVKMRNR